MKNTARKMISRCRQVGPQLPVRLGVLSVLIWTVWCAASSPAQEVKIWEFSPYEVGIRYSFDPSVSLSAVAQSSFLKQIDAELDRTFRATWRTHFSELPPALVNVVARDIHGFTVADLTSNELVLVVSLKHELSKTLRTYDAALEALPAIAISAVDLLALRSAAASQREVSDSEAGTEQDLNASTDLLLSKCVVDDGGLESIQQQLLADSIPAALVPRSSLSEVASAVRPLITMLPWQSESVFREFDKLFFVSIGAVGDGFRFRVRELDCPMQLLGPTFESTTSNWTHAARIASGTIILAFAPIARVEEAEATTANLRLRAGGLIVDESNPALIRVGDVLQPVVRRDDRNGVPTLLAPLSWTFAAVSHSDGVKMDANVYSYSGGPGLQGRKNRRTQRVLLRVRPLYEQTDVKVAVLGTDGEPQSGCFVYRRDLLTDQFEFLGRTDWRGRFTVAVPSDPGGFLPDAVRKQRDAAAKAARKLELEQAKPEVVAPQDVASQATTPGDASQTSTDPPAVGTEQNVASEAQAEVTQDPSLDPDVLPLNYALTRIYIKSGDSVLAMLPMVPGLKELETAELPDDSRRLEAEAFVRGFQGKILDLIGLRSLHAARVTLFLQDQQVKQAQAALEDLRRLSNYNEMADELREIQRVMLDESSGSISIRIKSRIDRMFQTTRDMLQKYLQDDLLSKSERAVKAALAASAPTG